MTGVLQVDASLGSVLPLLREDGQTQAAKVVSSSPGGGTLEWAFAGTIGEAEIPFFGVEPTYFPDGEGNIMQCTFPSWADGDVLYVQWSASLQIIGDEDTTIVRAYFAVSLDGGATFQVCNKGGNIWGASADPGGSKDIFIQGQGPIAIAGTTPPIVRLAYWYNLGLLQIKGTVDSTNGAAGQGVTITALRIPASQVVQAPIGVLQPF